MYESCPELNLYNHRFFEGITIPMSSNPHVLASEGHLELKAHMYVFYRDIRQSRDPKDDLLKLWVSDHGDVQACFPEELRGMEKVRDQLLGPVDQLKGGERDGTALERSGRGKGNLQGDRCLTFGQSIEAQRGIAHPAGNLSQAHKRGDETLENIKILERVSFLSNSYVIIFNNLYLSHLACYVRCCSSVEEDCSTELD